MPTVRGKAQVRAFISSTPERMTNVLRGAARAGAKVITTEIEERTPSHEVRENLRTRTQKGDGTIRVRIDIKPGWARSVGIWLEYGTAPHFISVDEGQRRGMSVRRINDLAKVHQGNHSLVIGGKFVGRTVLHPGARPHPAFRPALDTKEAEAVAAAQSYINSRVTRSGIVGEAEGDAE